uniref:TMC domain-containing protein n=1 Tax=Haptolina brevifila TaxID=156173 RepID=A0A7S2BGZ4_9EUKA|mmetsp:Transcript_12725/g.25656  ORF Transcript_12725/g.25656 Transcript_12725/m.25656 type:complete len:438 (+) Transcript_12725:815-2128(+)
MNAAALHQAKHAAISNLRTLQYEGEWKARLKLRPPREAYLLFARQLMVLGLHVLLQVGVWACILLIQVNSANIKAALPSGLISSLAPVVVYSACVEIMPLLVPTLARQCRWDNPASLRTHMTTGYYVGRVTGLLVLGLSELGMLLMWDTAVTARGSNSSSSTVPVFNTTLASELAAADTGLLYAFGREPSPEQFNCGQDQLGNKFLLQVVLGFITPKAFELSAASVRWLIDVKIRGKEWTRAPLKIEKKFIRNVYFQGLLWIAVPYLPLMSFLMPIVLYIEFKYDKAFLLRLCSKTTTPFQSNLDQFLIVHSLTLAFFVAVWCFIFLHEGFATAVCGPFRDLEAGLESAAADIYSHLASLSGGLADLITYFLSNSLMLWLAILGLTSVVFDQRFHIVSLENSKEQLIALEAVVKTRLAQRVENLAAEGTRLRRELAQ